MFNSFSSIWNLIVNTSIVFLKYVLIFFCVCVCVFQFSSVDQSCPTLCDRMDCSTPGFPVHHQLQELAQSHVH